MFLFISTYGTYVHIKDEIFEIRIPQSKQDTIKRYYAPQKLKGIMLSYGAAISTDAIILALKHNIDIVIFDSYGNPLGRLWHSKHGSTTLIRKSQLTHSISPEGIKTIINWITQKLKNRITLLNKLKKNRPTKTQQIETTTNKIQYYISEIKKLNTNKIPLEQIPPLIRSYEGNAGKIYFQQLSILLAKQYQFNGRSMQPAKDQFNAFLNYAYGILYSRIEKALVIAGIDPYVGILHRDDYNLKSMTLDFIEPYRIYAEEVVFKLFSAKKISQKHTDKFHNGVILNKEGKSLLVPNFIDFLDKNKITYHNKKRTRDQIIQIEAHKFAMQLIGKQYNTKTITL